MGSGGTPRGAHQEGGGDGGDLRLRTTVGDGEVCIRRRCMPGQGPTSRQSGVNRDGEGTGRLGGASQQGTGSNVGGGAAGPRRRGRPPPPKGVGTAESDGGLPAGHHPSVNASFRQDCR
ncbi:hypothetical protein SEMRO_2950_G340890.1 [Seminavis robusta]|uniref:Uncharacterized protein n=1 Tax=Seminavis robusta TaxID=568900 RepID=A0A9N8EYV0_9STRA|nr:hypothetical protein SEMRO_2950_G340890.1 [Seminavis robusta]|eukprot:Sro2950_g340890.1 n/a (119) ;mRNA; r:2314-2670